MYYYKTSAHTDVGTKLKSLLAEISACEAAAEACAKRLRVKTYDSPANYFGGIVSVSFPKRHIASPAIWHYTGEKDTNTKQKIYVLNVKVSEQAMLEADALLCKEESNTLVSDRRYTWSEMISFFTRSQAAEMAGVLLTAPSVVDLLRKTKLTDVEKSIITAGSSPMFVASKLDPDLVETILASQEINVQINSALGHKAFRLVQTIEGHACAIEIYKELSALPLVSASCFSRILGIEFSYVDDIFLFEEEVYISSDQELAVEGFSFITESDYGQKRDFYTARLRAEANKAVAKSVAP